jgi:hypothetical protein
MANAILTSTVVTREALRVLHQKLNFVGNVTRDYDSSFAQTGARIGTDLKVRLPNQYVIRSGPTLNAQDTAEAFATLQILQQKGVDLNFTSADLTLSLDDFSDRILEPAMCVLAANIEADALTMVQDVYQQMSNYTLAATFRGVLNGRKALVDALAPVNNRNVILNTQDNVDMVDSLKGLFQDSGTISKQNREGLLGRTAGFDFYENTLLNNYTRGSGTNAYTVNGAGQSGNQLIVAAGSGAMNKGDIFQIAGVFRVHPESKAATSTLQNFVVAAAYGGGAGTVTISPAIVFAATGRQNVSAAPANGAAITFLGTVGATNGLSLAFQQGAFAFATADLILPSGVDFAKREVMDGLSMRIVRAYDINNDKFPCRLDMLYGYKTIRPDLAVRLANN